VLWFQEEGPKEDEESDKSVSEVNDEDDAEDGSEEVSYFTPLQSKYL